MREYYQQVAPGQWERAWNPIVGERVDTYLGVGIIVKHQLDHPDWACEFIVRIDGKLIEWTDQTGQTVYTADIPFGWSMLTRLG